MIDYFEDTQPVQKEPSRGGYTAFLNPKQRFQEIGQEFKQEAKGLKAGGILGQEALIGAVSAIPNLADVINQLTTQGKQDYFAKEPLYKKLTSERIKEKYKDKLLVPETGMERAGERVGRFLGETAGLGGLKSGKAVLGAVSSAGAGQLAEELGAGKTGQAAAEIAGAFAPSALKKIAVSAGARLGINAAKEAKKISQFTVLERAVKGSPDKETLLEFAKAKNLTPKEASLLIQSNGKLKMLEKFGAKTKSLKRTAESLKEKIGETYDVLKEEGKLLGGLSVGEKRQLQNDITQIIRDISKSPVIGPDNKQAIQILKETSQNIAKQGQTIESLINARQNLSQSINWKSFDVKGTQLAKGREMFLNAIKRKNPQAGRMLELTDKANARMYPIFDAIEKKSSFADKALSLLPGGIISLVTATGKLFPKIALPIAANSTAKRLTTKFITDPKYQGMYRSLVKAVEKGATKSQIAIANALFETLKQDDEQLYQEYMQNMRQQPQRS